jgi:hypothetical protein
VGLKEGRYVLRELFGFHQDGVKDGAATGSFYVRKPPAKLLARFRSAGVDWNREKINRGDLTVEGTQPSEQAASPSHSVFRLANE